MPILPDIGVISLVSDHWLAPWTTRHQVLSRLAEYFHVIWVNPNVPPTADHNSVTSRPSASGGGGLSEDVPTVSSMPLWIQKSCGRRLAHYLRVQRAVRMLRKRGCSRIVAYIWNPNLDVSTRVLKWDVKCYHIDDEYTWAEMDQPIPEKEKRLLEQSDQVFVHSEQMLKKKGALNVNTSLVPNGVDFEAYIAPYEEPADLSTIPYPRIGCVGWIKRQLDLKMMSDLATRHPEWSLVLIGPTRPDAHFGKYLTELNLLRRTSNVHFLGSKPVNELPAYTQHLDVGILCYRVNDYTKYINPLKLHEYLGAGIPAVGSPIPALEPFRHVIEIAETLDEWSDSLTFSLAPSNRTDEHRAARRAVASRYDWNRLVRVIARTICARLGDRDLGRLDAAIAEHEAENVYG